MFQNKKKRHTLNTKKQGLGAWGTHIWLKRDLVSCLFQKGYIPSFKIPNRNLLYYSECHWSQCSSQALPTPTES